MPARSSEDNEPQDAKPDNETWIVYRDLKDVDKNGTPKEHRVKTSEWPQYERDHGF